MSPEKDDLNQQGQNTDSYERACDTALGWIARLRSDESSQEDLQSFALWLNEDSSHHRAMDQMMELWDDLGVVNKLSLGSQTREAANGPRWIAASVAMAACLVLAVFLWPQVDTTQPDSNTYQTAMGERSTVSLPDNSRVILNTDSSITVTYSDEQRHVSLARGEAWFDVAPSKLRPFHVDAGEARITAIGTAFNIHLMDKGTDVTVTEGVVRITELGETGSRAPATEVLRINQRLFTGGDGWSVATSDDTSHQLAWQQGELVAQEMPLPELLEQLQRYHRTRLLIGDPELATLTVSGVFHLDRPEATLKALELTLDLQARPLDENTIQLLKAGQ